MKSSPPRSRARRTIAWHSMPPRREAYACSARVSAVAHSGTFVPILAAMRAAAFPRASKLREGPRCASSARKKRKFLGSAPRTSANVSASAKSMDSAFSGM